jgi:hypothetical protein
LFPCGPQILAVFPIFLPYLLRFSNIDFDPFQSRENSQKLDLPKTAICLAILDIQCLLFYSLADTIFFSYFSGDNPRKERWREFQTTPFKCKSFDPFQSRIHRNSIYPKQPTMEQERL